MAGKKKARHGSTTRRQTGSAKGTKRKSIQKKKATKRSSLGTKQSARKQTTAKKKVAKKKTTPRKRTTSTRSPSRKTPRGSHSASTKGTLGRPKVTGEEKLFLLFKQDYHARQVFGFLGVETVKELEQYEPDQIIKLLSQPIRQAVRQIRAKLAENNRSLRGDKEFALRFQERNKP
tara:strand:- start:96 stop:623 length:528 start_codon:yes stop_codon:yes gene_type:complete